MIFAVDTLVKDNFFSFPQGGMVPFAERALLSEETDFFNSQMYWPLSWIGLNRLKISKKISSKFFQ